MSRVFRVGLSLLDITQSTRYGLSVHQRKRASAAGPHIFLSDLVYQTHCFLRRSIYLAGESRFAPSLQLCRQCPYSLLGHFEGHTNAAHRIRTNLPINVWKVGQKSPSGAFVIWTTLSLFSMTN
ncbi:hypothetical protein I7I53_00559 [Histoplasma capsulatum var. duboisii H88]|uniref:Uncharacterized protein n=1 Tax=Ajellomyces capsulatus (strain H88) TaxID=544711 RepID=A0A8A1LHH5_AJEC8|nr:hypothetical protein I7I53_00559 [Histoplasma capsulatum var. duboisii H88]